jgi:hypothetical protein
LEIGCKLRQELARVEASARRHVDHLLIADIPTNLAGQPCDDSIKLRLRIGRKFECRDRAQLSRRSFFG